MNPKSGNHRVLLVLLLFVPFSIIAMWFVSGAEQKIELAVSSNLSPAEMQHRFDRIVAKLESLSPEQIANHALRIQDWEGSGQNWQHNHFQKSPFQNSEFEDSQFGDGISLETRPVKFQTQSPVVPSTTLMGLNASSTDFSFMLCDIVFPMQNEDQLDLEIDPTIIYRDPDFAESTVARNWLGKDQASIYLQETDGDKHLRLIRLERDKLQFLPTLVNGETGSKVVYEISICHQGLKRIYGKFLERGCESIALSRLEWICNQLEQESE